MRKRGQLFDQPFILIFGIVVGALILVWGGKMIYDLKTTGDKVEVELFINNLRKEIDKQYYYDVGSQKEIVLKLPAEVEQICFYDKDEGTNQLIGDELKLVINLRSSENTFLITPIPYDQIRFKIDKLRIKEKNPLCLRNKDKYVIITGKDYVEIK